MKVLFIVLLVSAVNCFDSEDLKDKLKLFKRKAVDLTDRAEKYLSGLDLESKSSGVEDVLKEIASRQRRSADLLKKPFQNDRALKELIKEEHFYHDELAKGEKVAKHLNGDGGVVKNKLHH